jgi:hypothetical protein
MPNEEQKQGDQYHEWQAPPVGSEPAKSAPRRLAWLNESTEEGQAWIKSQRGFSDIKKALETLSGKDFGTGPLAGEYRSRVNPNPLKRDVREVVGALSKLKPFWGYHSDNTAYAEQAEMMNKVTRAWYLESFADRKVREALQWAAATARGWVRPIYRRAMYGTGKGDIILLTYGSPCVLPNQIPSSNDWQSAYVVHILDEMPIAMAHGMFPYHQAQITPTTSKYWYANDAVRKAAQGNLMQRIFGLGRPRRESALSDLLVPIRYSYIIDLAVNRTGAAVPMGEPGASWSYTVPYVGQEIPVSKDPQTGHVLSRKANENDARLYPYRRLMISTDQVIMYDGPAFDWHGMFPAVSFSIDDYPWEQLGFSLVHDGFEMNEAVKKIYRGNMDKIGAQLQPSYAFDENAIARKEAQAFDPFMPNARLGFDGSTSEAPPFHQAMDPESLKVQPESMSMIESLKEEIHSQLAVHDITALAKMRAVGSMDELQKVMEANGPIVEDASRSMEPPMRDLGNMVKYLILQYYNTARVMQYVGPNGVARQVFDYDPAKLVPSHMPGENPSNGASASDVITRARTFADNLRFMITPGSLHELTQMVMKLGLLQMRKAGVMISSQTIAEAFGVANYGVLEGNTEMEKWKSEQEIQLEFAAKLAELKATLPGLNQGGQPPGAAAPGKAPEGRPSTDAAPPKLVSKDSGARSTITTSK